MKNKNQVMVFNIDHLSPFGTRIIDIDAFITHQLPGKPLPSEGSESYLQPSENVESDHPDILFLAEKLKKNTTMETAKNIFDWVSSNIAFSGYSKETRGALYALEQKKGDCTEFMCLFVALCRACGISARGIGGYTCSGNCILKPSEYHNWAEFHVNKKWLIADCQKKIFNPQNDHYIAMNILSENPKNPMQSFARFRFQGEGLKVKMNL